MRGEKGHFLLHGGLDGYLILDVLLGSVLNSDETETELNLLVHDRALSVCASVHDVNLGDDTDGPDTLGVDPASHSQTLLRRHISVSGNDTKNDGARIGHISLSHLASDLLNVFWLSCNWDQRDTWEIDKGQIWASVRVHVEHDRVVNDVGVGATDLVGERNDGVSDFLKVCEFLSFHLLREFGPRLGPLGLMVESELERATRHETISSGKEVQSDD